MLARLTCLLAVVLSGSVVASAAHADTPACPAVSVTTVLRASEPVLDWSENVGFDADGNLWVARVVRNQLERYDAHGRRTATVAVTAPGAVRLGPDGWLYVTSGANPLYQIPGLRLGAVVRIDPAAATPVAVPFAVGLGMPNGLGFDAAGNVYVADSNWLSGVVRLRPDGTVDTAWTARAPRNFDILAGVDGYLLNGLAVSGAALYVSVSASVHGRVLRIPIEAPERASVSAQITAGFAPVPGLADDLAAVGDYLYIATAVGRLARVDLRTGQTCTITWNQPMTSVAAAPDRRDELTVGTESGDVLRVRLR